MSVLRITLVLKTNEGGRWVIPHIQEMLRRGHIVSVIIPPGEGRLTALLRELDVSIYFSRFDFRFAPKLGVLTDLLALRGQIVETRPDVLHYHLYASALAVRVCSLGMNVPRVHMVAGPLYLESSLVRAVERVLMWRDSILIAGSNHTLEQYLALGLPEKRLRSVPYGVNTVVFRPPSKPEREQARRELDISPDEFVAIIVAYVYGPKRLVHGHAGIKGHDILLSAWTKFSSQKTGVRLLLVGGGFDASGRTHRSRMMKEYGERCGNIEWVESVSAVNQYYWASNVSVSPSLSENHGAALEAGACGVARIVSDAGGLPETTTESSGWIVPKGDVDSLRKALEEAYLEFQLGTLVEKNDASRRQMVQSFDAEMSANEVVNIIENSVTAPRSAVITLVSEARLGTTVDGAVAALDAASGPVAWSRYQSRIGGFRLAARTSDTLGSGDVVLDSVSVYKLPYYVGMRKFVVKLPTLLRHCWYLARTSDGLIVRLPGPLGFMTVPMAKLLRKPLFVEVVGDPETVLRDNPSRIIRTLAVPARHAMRYCVRAADASRFVTNTLLQRVYPPRPESRSLKMSNVQLRDDDFNSIYAIPKAGKWRLTAIGSQETNYKGHDVAIQALLRLREHGYECELLLVGRGSLHASLMEQARTLLDPSVVRFVEGYKSKPELWAILDKTDIFIHPSRSEGLPRVVIEAMARSRPVIATEVGGIPELLPAEALVVAGSSDALADRIGQMIDNPDEAKTAAVENYSTANNYHYDKLEAVFGEWCEVVSKHVHSH